MNTYIVCDRCAHTVASPDADYEVSYGECEHCRSTALWAFPSLDKAEAHSQLILDRQARTLHLPGRYL